MYSDFSMLNVLILLATWPPREDSQGFHRAWIRWRSVETVLPRIPQRNETWRCKKFEMIFSGRMEFLCAVSNGCIEMWYFTFYWHSIMCHCFCFYVKPKGQFSTERSQSLHAWEPWSSGRAAISCIYFFVSKFTAETLYMGNILSFYKCHIYTSVI